MERIIFIVLGIISILFTLGLIYSWRSQYKEDPDDLFCYLAPAGLIAGFISIIVSFVVALTVF